MPVLIERERPSKQQLKAVQAYIMRRRLKERQALEESRAKEEAEKQRKREEEKKKETVEDVKMEISKLEAKLEALKNEKHQLFLQLKKVLNEDEEKRQKERQSSVMMPPQHPHPLMGSSVHRMPYVMMTPRPAFGNMPRNVPSSQPMATTNVPSKMLVPARVETPITSAPGGTRDLPNTPQEYQGHHSNQPSRHPYPVSFGGGSNYPFGQVTTSNAQPEKHFKITNTGNQGQVLPGNNPIPQSTVITPMAPVNVVTSYTPTPTLSTSGNQLSPYHQQTNQQLIPLQESKHVSPKPAIASSASPLGLSVPGQQPHPAEQGPFHGKQPVKQQHPQHPLSTHQLVPVQYPKHEAKPSTPYQKQDSNKPVQYPVTQQIQYPRQEASPSTQKPIQTVQYPKHDINQSTLHPPQYHKRDVPPSHQKYQSQQVEQQHTKLPVYQTQPKPEDGLQQQICNVPPPPPPPVQNQQHKQAQSYILSKNPENTSQDYPHQRLQQYGMHSYQQHSKQPTQSYTSQPPSQQQTKKQPDNDQQKQQSFQMPLTQQQQAYGYPIQAQQQAYPDHQQYVGKNQGLHQQPQGQVSYPHPAPQTGQLQQQSYPGYSNVQEQQAASLYSQQQTSYPIQQQVYGYPAQQYQAQPYGYSIPVDHQGQQQPQQHQAATHSYQPAPQSPQQGKTQSRQAQFDPSKVDQQMPPPPPQRPPPPKQEQSQTSTGGHSTHYGDFSNSQTSKRPSHRYNPYSQSKRDHHTSSSSKSKYSDKHPSSQDEHSGSSSHSSRHYYHPSSKSSHGKGSSSSSSQHRQSKYH